MTTTTTVKAMLKKKNADADVLIFEGLKEELTRLGERIAGQAIRVRDEQRVAVDALRAQIRRQDLDLGEPSQALKKGLLDLRAMTNLVPTPDEMDFGAYWPMLADHVATGVQLIAGQLQTTFGFELSEEEASKEVAAVDAAGERYMAAMEKERASKPAALVDDGEAAAWRAWALKTAFLDPSDFKKKNDEQVRAACNGAMPSATAQRLRELVNKAVVGLINIVGQPSAFHDDTLLELIDMIRSAHEAERQRVRDLENAPIGEELTRIATAPLPASPLTSFRVDIAKMTALREKARAEDVAAEEPVVAAEEPVVAAEEPVVAAEEPAAAEDAAAAEEPANDESTDKAPPVLLAHKWDVDVDLTGWWMSEKLDGVRAYWNGVNFVSRLGNVFHAPAWFTDDFPKHPLDGELWLSRQEFQKCVSIVRRHDAGDEWKQICFVVFDAPHLEAPFEERFAFLQEHFGDGSTTPYIRVLEQVQLENIEQLKTELARVEGLGGEGLMMRQPGSLYEAGRSHTLLKVKTFHDAEAVVVEHEPGKGKHKGRLGALICTSATGKRFNVGTGFSDAEREAPPAIGETVTYRYQELTKDGIPRFPSYVGRAIDKPAVVVEDSEHVVSRVNTVKGQASVRVYAQTEPVGITTTWGPLETAIRWPSFAEAEKRKVRGSIIVAVADIPATLAADEVRAAERAAAKASA